MADGSIDSVFKQVEQATWGEQQAKIKAGLSGPSIFTDKNIIVVPAGKLASNGSLNYLFMEKTSRLYNMAWYVATPINEIKTARSLESKLEKALKAKYGKPVLSHSHGSPGDVKDAQKKSAEITKAKEALAKAQNSKKGGLRR